MKVRAGILIHILFLASIFALVLDFYLFSTVSDQNNLILQREELKTRLAKDIEDQLENSQASSAEAGADSSGEPSFDEGD